MLQIVHTRTIAGLLLLVFACFVGCSDSSKPSEPMFTVKGTVTKGGKPLPLNPALAAAKAARVEVQFLRTGGGSDFSTTAFAEPDGTFEAKNVPAGTYSIGVTHLDGTPGDKLKGKFEARKSPIERTISGDTQDLKIDLDKPKA